MSEAPPAIVYVHGIGNKPRAAVLKAQWDAALGGDAARRSRLAYWVDRRRYPVPAEGTSRDGDRVSVDLPAPLARASGDRPAGDAGALARDLAAIGCPPLHRRALVAIGERMLIRGAGEADSEAGSGRVMPLPPAMRRWIVRQLTRLFLGDAHAFLFVEAERARVRSVLDEAVGSSRSVVIVAHSLGSLIAYDWLASEAARGVRVPVLLTVGSPLGLVEVQELMRGWLDLPALSAPPAVERWVNVAERLDPVAADATLADDLGPGARMVDRGGIGLNEDAPWHPHSATGYLRSAAAREALTDAP